MLVLSRKKLESIVVGNSIVLAENVVITVVEVRGDKVRLGIEAPRSVRVDRLEVRDRIDAAQQDASGNGISNEKQLAMPVSRAG